MAQIETTEEEKALLAKELAPETGSTPVEVQEPETTLVEPIPEASWELDVGGSIIDSRGTALFFS